MRTFLLAMIFLCTTACGPMQESLSDNGTSGEFSDEVSNYAAPLNLTEANGEPAREQTQFPDRLLNRTLLVSGQCEQETGEGDVDPNVCGPLNTTYYFGGMTLKITKNEAGQLVATNIVVNDNPELLSKYLANEMTLKDDKGELYYDDIKVYDQKYNRLWIKIDAKKLSLVYEWKHYIVDPNNICNNKTDVLICNASYKF